MVGALSIPIGKGANALKRAASIRVLQHAAAADVQKLSQYPLKKKVIGLYSLFMFYLLILYRTCCLRSVYIWLSCVKFYLSVDCFI